MDETIDAAGPVVVYPTLESIFAAEAGPLVRLASLLTGSPTAAEEIVQDAFVGLISRWQMIESPGAYLRIAVLNGCRSHGRRLVVARRHAPKLFVPHGPDGEPDVLQDAVARLPHRQRSAVVLRYWLDLSEREIALHLGCRPGTVKSLLSRALESLRSEVEK